MDERQLALWPLSWIIELLPKGFFCSEKIKTVVLFSNFFSHFPVDISNYWLRSDVMCHASIIPTSRSADDAERTKK